MLDSNPSWVAVMTFTGAEKLVADRLREADHPIECYLPLLAERDKRFKRDQLPEKPMFPSYIFARISNKEIYQTRTTRGVIAIVSSQHSIIRVPDSDIEAVRRFEASQRKIHLCDTSQLVRGARVTLLDGEFKGMEGTLLRHCKQGNFCVSIEVMNISIVTHVRRDELKAKTTAEDTPQC